MKVLAAPSFFKSLKKLNSSFRWWGKFTYWVKSHCTKDFWNVFKVTLKGYPYDSSYMLQMERAKLTEIANYIEKHKRFVGWENTVREIRAAVSLIGIILEEPQLFHFTGDIEFNQLESGDYEMTHTPDFAYVCDVHVNTRNMDRFIDDDKVKEMYMKYPHKLYIKKATVLYNKMRTEKLYSWGD